MGTFWTSDISTLIGLIAVGVWLTLAVLIGFANMLGSLLAHLRGRLAGAYNKFKVEAGVENKDVNREAACRLDAGDYPSSYLGYNKRQADIQVCTEADKARHCSLAAAESLANWVRELFMDLDAKKLQNEKKDFVEGLLQKIAGTQELLLKKSSEE